MNIESTQSLPDEVYAHLLDKIQDCTWKAGDKIPSESQICKSFQVSRITARGALQKLQAQNLIVTKPGKGSFVTSGQVSENLVSLAVMRMDLSENDYKYVTELRKALEFTSIDLLASQGNEEDFARIKDALARMKAAGSDVGRYVEADYEFHEAIIKGSHNPLFASVYGGCRKEVEKYFHEMAEVSDGDFSRALFNHTAICNAIVSRNPAKAKEIIEGTFEFNLIRFKSKFKKEVPDENN